MVKLFLEVPSLKRKEEALDYLKENVNCGSEINGTGNMDRCLKEITYEEWLDELINNPNIEYVKGLNKCLSKTFFVIRKEDNRIVGMINVRYNIPEQFLSSWASHIGYGIRPSERRKGYAKIALYLALLEEKKLNEKVVLLECTANNIGSNKTILALGGELIKTEIDNYDEEMTNYYNIDVDDAIDKYEDVFRKYIEKEDER